MHRQGSMQARDPPWLSNPGETSPEVQNRGISGPTKMTYVLKKLFKKKEWETSMSTQFTSPFTENWTHIPISWSRFRIQLSSPCFSNFKLNNSRTEQESHSHLFYNLPSSCARTKHATALSSKISFILLFSSIYSNQCVVICWTVDFWFEMQ